MIALMAEMNRRALDLGVPLSIRLDVTCRYNERCVHCYLDHADHGEVSTAGIRDLSEQSADARRLFPYPQWRRNPNAYALRADARFQLYFHLLPWQPRHTQPKPSRNWRAICA